MAPRAGQLKKIWAAAREIGLEEEELRDRVQELSGQRSLRQLSQARADELIELLVRAGARAGTRRTKPSGRRTAANETLLITPGQRDDIARRRAQLGGDWLRDEYFGGACRKRIKAAYPRTGGEAAAVIEMLKQRQAYNRRKARNGPRG